jgi:hypothetical protein
VLRGGDWQIAERDAGGRKFYDLLLYPGERGIYEILPEALRAASKFAAERGTWVTYTVWVGGRNGRRPVSLIVGAGGILIRTVRGAVSLRRIRRLLEIAVRVDDEIARGAQNAGEGGSEQDE